MKPQRKIVAVTAFSSKKIDFVLIADKFFCLETKRLKAIGKGVARFSLIDFKWQNNRYGSMIHIIIPPRRCPMKIKQSFAIFSSCRTEHASSSQICSVSQNPCCLACYSFSFSQKNIPFTLQFFYIELASCTILKICPTTISIPDKRSFLSLKIKTSHGP